MDTLFDLTNKRSGVVLWRGCPALILDDWRSVHGIPRWFGEEWRALGEPIPRMHRHYDDDLGYWLHGVDVGDRLQPYRGFVYQDGDDLVIIAPDE